MGYDIQYWAKVLCHHSFYLGMWGIVFFYPGIAWWFKIVLFCFHHSISVDMIQTPLSEMQRKSWQLPAKISNLVSSLTLSLCFQPTSNWDSFWWGFRLSGPYSLFSCFLKKWLRLSSAVDSFSGLPLFSCPTLYSNFQGNQACWHAWFLFTYSFGIILLL